MVRAVLLPIHPVTDHLAQPPPCPPRPVQFSSAPPPNKQAYVPINTNSRGECLCSISRAKTAHAHAAGLIDNPASQPGQTSSTRPLSHRAVKVSTYSSLRRNSRNRQPWVIGSSSPPSILFSSVPIRAMGINSNPLPLHRLSAARRGSRMGNPANKNGGN